MRFSFDVGYKNFGIYIESLCDTPLYLDNLCVYPYSFEKLFSVLNEIFTEYEPTLVLIERQLKVNTTAITIAAHLEALIKTKFSKCKVEFVSSKKKKFMKTDKKNLSYKDRKLLAVDSAMIFLEQDIQKECFEKFLSLKKKDDVADAICQLLEYRGYLFDETQLAIPKEKKSL